VWIAWAGGDVTRARLWRFSGDRAAIREQAVAAALRGAVGQVAGVSGDEPEV
ncbi:MAG TPA: damage-inducible protein CinA, partial [Chromatiaceae bacterium]|nr:damage-inducible protein CinA [Chromatiaceae bacterium]